MNLLLKLKMDSPVIREIPRVDKMNEYLDSSIEETKDIVKSMEEGKIPDWKELNNIFLGEL